MIFPTSTLMYIFTMEMKENAFLSTSMMMRTLKTLSILLCDCIQTRTTEL